MAVTVSDASPPLHIAPPQPLAVGAIGVSKNEFDNSACLMVVAVAAVAFAASRTVRVTVVSADTFLAVATKVLPFTVESTGSAEESLENTAYPGLPPLMVKVTGVSGYMVTVAGSTARLPAVVPDDEDTPAPPQELSASTMAPTNPNFTAMSRNH